MKDRGEGSGFGRDRESRRTDGGVEIMQHGLDQVLAGQRFFLAHSGRGDELNEGTVVKESFEALDSNQQKRVLEHVRLMQLLTGHQGSLLRKTVHVLDSEQSEQLKNLLQWAEHAVISDEMGVESLATHVVDPLLTTATDAQSLYERLQFTKRFGDVSVDAYEETLRQATHRVLRFGEHEGWSALTAAAFRSGGKENIGRLLTILGFIPTELYQDPSFSQISSREFVQSERTLRLLERDEAIGDQAHNERTKLITAFFLSGNARMLRSEGKGSRHITLDSNGVRIFFDGRAGKTKLIDHPFVAHIPYGLVTDALAEEWSEHWLQNEAEGLELQLRRAEENFDLENRQAKREHQLAAFADHMGFSTAQPEQTLGNLLDELLQFPDRFAKRILEKGELLPDRLIETVLEQGEAGVFALMRFAEGVSTTVVDEQLSHKRLFLEHGIRDSRHQAYKARARVLGDPRHYNALKGVRAVLQTQPVSDPEKQFLFFRGQYKRSGEGRQHSFLETVYEGHIARVLIDEEKDMKPDQRGQVPVFDREVYEEIEESLRAFDYFLERIDRVERLVTYKNKHWEQKILEEAEEAAVFILTNVTQFHAEVDRIVDGLRVEVNDQDIEQLVRQFKQAAVVYRQFLYQEATPDLVGFRDVFRPSVHVNEVEFDQRFLDLAKDQCPEWGYDAELCLESPSIRVVAINHVITHPSETIPVDMEEAVLDKLRVNRNCPLINVVGGCKNVGSVEGTDDHPLNKMSLAVLTVAHEAKANIAVPGTQSGVGVFFGQQNVRYKTQTDHLPFKDKAHLFAVSPGGNTLYEGNPFVDKEKSSEIYAVTPVDSVVTPTTALWSEKGEKRVEAYRLHIAYMESLFARISKDQPRVLVAGNGGVFSIMEVNESLKRGFDIVLVSDSGRFAEAAAVVVRNIDLLPETSDPEFDLHVVRLLQGVLDDETVDEHFQKDFGSTELPVSEEDLGEITHDDLRPNYIVHRQAFRAFVDLARRYPERIHASRLDDLEQALRGFMSVV